MFKISALALAFLASTAQAAGEFDWNITEAAEFIDVTFDDARDTSEIRLTYDASNKDTTVKIYDYDNCNTTDPEDAITITGGENPTRGSETFSIDLDFNQTAIGSGNSIFYTTSGDAQMGTIKLCVRVDLNADLDGNGTGLDANGFEESINFHESKLLIEVDMTKGFEVTDVTTDRTAATETNTTAELDYTVLAFTTDDAGAEDNTQVYAQGSFLTIGIITNGTGVEVADIVQMNITGNTDYDSISAGQESALTEKTCGADEITYGGSATSGCKVKTMLVSDFFDTESPDPLTIKGLAVMKFASGRRLSSVSARGLQEASDAADDTFGLTVPLQPMDMGEDNIDNNNVEVDMIDSAAASPASVVAGVVVALFSFLLL